MLQATTSPYAGTRDAHPGGPVRPDARRERPRPGEAIGDRILAMLAGGEARHADIVRAFPEALPTSVSVALLRLCKAGHLVQPRRGHYALPVEAASDPAPGEAALSMIRAMRPGDAFCVAALASASGVSYQVAQNAISRFLKAGVIERRARGAYVRAGAPARAGSAPLPLYDEVLGIMSRGGGRATVPEVQALMHPSHGPTAASQTLCNLYRAGLVVRIGRGAYALAPKGSVRTAQPVPRDPAETALAAMRRGGLWRTRDIAEEMACTPASAGILLGRLEATGRAVHVMYGEWRAHDAEADLARDAHTQAPAIVGRVYSAPGHLLAAEEHRRLYGEGFAGIAPRVHHIKAAGHLESAGHGVLRVPAPWAAALASRLAVREPLPPLTPLGARMVEALRDEPPLRKVDVAARLGVGRGVAIRMVDRLVSEGRMVEVAAGAFMVG